MSDYSGTITLDGETIRYRFARGGEWALALSQVRVIGEATDPYGPLADDYFLCFACGPDTWREASFYSEGRDEFRRALGARLGAGIELRLCASTDFASNVLWPPELAGQPMFEYTDVPPRTWLGRWIGRWIGPLRVDQTYSNAVAAVLANRG